MLLDQRTFLVKERVAVLKLTDTYDLISPETGLAVGIAREQPAPWAKFLRLLINKQFLPTIINVYEDEAGPPVLTLRKGASFLRATVEVTLASGETVGRMRSKLFSLGGGFHLLDRAGLPAGEVKGDWKGWNFKLLDAGGREVGTVTKKWAGLGRELLTSADNYLVAVPPTATGGQRDAALALAAGLAIDIIFKENK